MVDSHVLKKQGFLGSVFFRKTLWKSMAFLLYSAPELFRLCFIENQAHEKNQASPQNAGKSVFYPPQLKAKADKL
jgi:hypothetical protein